MQRELTALERMREHVRTGLRPAEGWAPPPLDTTGRINGDHALNPGQAPATARKRAAVLVPMIERPEGLSVLFTRRAAHLSGHAGQISFPGGREEDGDPDAIACALRETEEEIGLPRRFVQIGGLLDLYVTVTGYAVTPVVGFVTPGFDLAPDAEEVAEVFEAPLDFLMNPANHKRGARTWNGTVRHFLAIPYNGQYIWGATAGMLMNLYRRLNGL